MSGIQLACKGRLIVVFGFWYAVAVANCYFPFLFCQVQGATWERGIGYQASSLLAKVGWLLICCATRVDHCFFWVGELIVLIVLILLFYCKSWLLIVFFFGNPGPVHPVHCFLVQQLALDGTSLLCRLIVVYLIVVFVWFFWRVAPMCCFHFLWHRLIVFVYSAAQVVTCFITWFFCFLFY